MGTFTFVSLMPFHKGVLYRKGKPVKDVGPGRHGVWAGKEKIIYVDVRPSTVSFANCAVALPDGFTAVYGLSGSAEVRDARKAIYASNNPNNLAAFVFLASARSVLGQYSCDALKLKKEAISTEIADKAKARLSTAGMELTNFRLTQLALAPAVAPAATPGVPK